MNNAKRIFALGFFDGVHLGHQALLKECVSLARNGDCKTAAITFDRHPQSLFREAPALISTETDREYLLRHYGMDPAGQPVWILGTGGASKAARYVAEAMGASEVHLVSRTPHDGACSYDELAERGSGLVINCTPAGMHPRPDLCPLTPPQAERLFPRLTGVCDMIYNPPETILTHRAKAAGIPACTGLYMLVEQAVEAERLWFPDIDIPADMTARVLKELTLF